MSEIKLPLSGRQLGEFKYLIAHRNITTFLKEIPAERKLVVKFEELVRNPGKVCEQIAAFLGKEFHEGMLKPYAEKSERMTGGLNGNGPILGDTKFTTYNRIEPSVADRWKEGHGEEFLSEMTRSLASEMGYEQTEPELAQVGSET